LGPPSLTTGSAPAFASFCTDTQRATGTTFAKCEAMGRVLIIEDNDDLRAILRHALQAEGFEVSVASSGHKGLELQRQGPASIVVTDIFMPDGEGIETIAVLRTEFPQAKIIAISGGGKAIGGDYLPVAKELGVEKALRKPFELDEFVNAVRDLAR
jgi:DNA-binding response OmpR family regulator